MTTRYTSTNLTELAKVRSFKFDALEESSDGREWRLGALGFWKASQDPVHFYARRVPTYRRGSLVYDLPPEARLTTVGFHLHDGAPATAIVLRSPSEEVFAAWTRDESQAEQIVAFMNDELDALRRALAAPAAAPQE
jgi:hypothetical protein